MLQRVQVVPPRFRQVVERRLDLLNRVSIVRTQNCEHYKFRDSFSKIPSLHPREAAVALVLDVGDADGESITVVVAEAAVVLRVRKLLRSLKLGGDWVSPVKIDPSRQTAC